jgi:hypothetical protein
MVKIYNKDTKEFLGRISEADLQFLTDQLEEDRLKDTDYYIRRETLETFAGLGASAHLIEVLQGGLRALNSLEICWEKDPNSEAGAKK